MDDFKSWPKIPRLENEVWDVTEKLDGTNGMILIDNYGNMRVGSRNKWLSLEEDNYGFARWTKEHAEDLLKLGAGYHYGEWYGQGIQRGYRLDHKRFALFYYSKGGTTPDCCTRVPEIISTNSLALAKEIAIQTLLEVGSLAVPGYMNPEGFILRSKLTGARYKVIINE